MHYRIGKTMPMKMRRRNRKMGRWAVRLKVKKLENIIPGGRGSKPERLLHRTADYIMLLRLQIHVLQNISKLYIP